MIPLTPELLPEMYRWNEEEPHPEWYSCRPVRTGEAKAAYLARWKKIIASPDRRCFLLMQRENPVGKISLFDYNFRNRSAEFGYYLPERFRRRGLGTVMARLFLSEVFRDEFLALNKLIATTSSGNLPSLRLLEKVGFHLDGRQREHYWIGVERFDQLIYSLLRPEWERREGARK